MSLQKTTASIPTSLTQLSWQSLQMGQLIGNGGYGDVYYATWQGIEVAVKQLHLKTLSGDLSVDFQREASIMAQCQFPHVVRLYGVCEEPGRIGMVMEYLPKGSLYQVLHDSKETLPWNPVRWNIAIDMGKGLAYLHSQNIVHRDLKSLNVLLDSQYHAKITDFGLAKIKLETNSTTTKTTKQGMGTTRWMAPELLDMENEPSPNKASDVYSYGMILWEIAAREIPFKNAKNETVAGMWIMQGKKEKLPADCSFSYAEVVQACWKASNERPSAEKVVNELTQAKPPEEVKPAEAKVYLEKSWHFDPETKAQRVADADVYKLVEATDKDKQKAIQFYQHHPVPGYEIGSVQVIYNPNMNHKFALHLGELQQCENNPAFKPKWPMGQEHPYDPIESPEKIQWRTKVHQQFKDLAKPHQDHDYPAVNLLPMWHGTKAEIVDSICRTGYANLATTDSGFFGKGIYGAYEAEYSYRVYAKKGGALILNWTATFSAYPVIDGDMKKFMMINTEGKEVSIGNYSNYDAHFALVVPANPLNPNETVYYPTKPNQPHTYTELVVFQKAACLPRYLVQLRPTLVKTVPAPASATIAPTSGDPASITTTTMMIPAITPPVTISSVATATQAATQAPISHKKDLQEQLLEAWLKGDIVLVKELEFKGTSLLSSDQKQLKPSQQVEAIAKIVQDKINTTDLAMLLTWVTEGHLVEVEVLLKKAPILALGLGTIADLSDREFKNITALQYAAWALDIEMCELIMSYSSTYHSTIQLKAIAEEPQIYSSHGANYDVMPLVNKYQLYYGNFSNFRQWNSDEKECQQYWQKEIGGKQRKCPAWLVYAWCEEGKSVAWMKEDCDQKIKREYDKHHLDWWFTKSYNNGKGVGSTWSAARNLDISSYYWRKSVRAAKVHDDGDPRFQTMALYSEEKSILILGAIHREALQRLIASIDNPLILPQAPFSSSSPTITDTQFVFLPDNGLDTVTKKQTRQEKLIYCLLKGDLDAAKKLELAGASFQHRNRGGVYPLVAAVYGTSLEAVKYVEDKVRDEAELQWLTMDMERAKKEIESEILVLAELNPDATYIDLGNWYQQVGVTSRHTNRYDNECLKRAKNSVPYWAHEDWHERKACMDKGYSVGNKVFEKYEGGLYINWEQGYGRSKMGCPSRAIHDAVVKQIREELSELRKYVEAKVDKNYLEWDGGKNLAKVIEVADKGNTSAQYYLGWCYQNGEVITKDLNQAVKYYQLAADQGHTNAQYRLGGCYRNGEGVTKDLTQAMKYFRLAAERGHAIAQNGLGECYQNAESMDKNLSQAVKCFQLAADQGNATAQNNLGWCYQNSLGVSENWQQVVKYYELAANQGCADAQCNLALYCYEPSWEEDKRSSGFFGKNLKRQRQIAEYYWLAAEQGNAVAQNGLGLLYYVGDILVKDLFRAVKYFQIAADQGDATAYNNLGWCYQNGEGVTKDLVHAMKYFQLAADQGNITAQLNLGFCYQIGVGVAKDAAQAVKYFRLAAGQGNEVATLNLIWCYESGYGVDRDSTQGMKYANSPINQKKIIVQNGLGFFSSGEDHGARYLQLAADSGYGGAQYILANYYSFGDVRKDLAKAAKYYQLAADQGIGIAQFELGNRYYDGTGGVSKDFAQAVKYYQLTVEKGYSMAFQIWERGQAEYRLGLCYKNGEGVSKDLTLAAKYFQLAVDRGQKDQAEFQLGCCYYDGEGVTKDLAQAVKHFELAACWGGMAKAKYKLALCYKNGEGIAQDLTQAVKYFQLAADEGDVAAQCNLALCYQNGKGVAKDLTQAVKYFQLAADGGNVTAQYNLALCHQNGEGAAKDLVQAVKYYLLAVNQGDTLAKANLEQLLNPPLSYPQPTVSTTTATYTSPISQPAAIEKQKSNQDTDKETNKEKEEKCLVM